MRKLVIKKTSEYHDFYIGERVDLVEDYGNGFYLVESDLRQSIVRECDIREYSSIDEYEDMYCDVCGGTACHCG